MIVTDTLAAKMTLDGHYEHDADALNYIAREIGREVKHLGESVGYFVGDESYFVQRGKGHPVTMQFDLVGYWCPDPALGCEFRGGPNDGKMVPIWRESDGRPMEFFVLPQEMMPPVMLGVGEMPELTQSTRYRRVGIDSEHDRWVYEID